MTKTCLSRRHLLTALFYWTQSAVSVPPADHNIVMTPCPEPTPATTQRQSCDRCYKQKLRCVRGKEGNSGVCDRCLSKRVQCIYSYSLPKGRPSLNRLSERSKASNSSGTSPKGLPSGSAQDNMARPTTGVCLLLPIDNLKVTFTNLLSP